MTYKIKFSENMARQLREPKETFSTRKKAERYGIQKYGSGSFMEHGNGVVGGWEVVYVPSSEVEIIELGTKVRLRDDVLRRHSRNVPAHAGYTKEQFAWRETLDKLEGKTGVVTRVFPNSNNVNVDFNGHLIGIDKTELVVVGGKGWHGDTPGHHDAALKNKNKGTLTAPIKASKPHSENCTCPDCTGESAYERNEQRKIKAWDAANIQW